MSLQTRKPTGKVAWPLLLVEGEEKAGKTYASLALSADERIGRTFAFDMGEGTIDEYASLGPYEVVDHNGTFSDLVTKVEEATREPLIDGKPNVVVIDSATAVWDLLRDGARQRARRSRRGQEAIRKDPDAEVNIGNELWNQANDRWGRLIRALRFSSTIGVLIAHGKEVTAMKDGVPVAGQTEWKVEAQKNLPRVATGWVRMARPHTATVVGVRSLTASVPPQGLLLPNEAPLAHLVFDVLGAGAEFGSSSSVDGVVEWDARQAQHQLLEVVTELKLPDPKATARAVWDAVVPDGATEMTDDLWAQLEGAARERVPS